MKCTKCITDNPSDSKYCKEFATPFPSRDEISAPTKTLKVPLKELEIGVAFSGRKFLQFETMKDLLCNGENKVHSLQFISPNSF